MYIMAVFRKQFSFTELRDLPIGTLSIINELAREKEEKAQTPEGKKELEGEAVAELFDM